MASSYSRLARREQRRDELAERVRAIVERYPLYEGLAGAGVTPSA